MYVTLKEFTILTTGVWDIDSCIGTLEKYIKKSKMQSSYRKIADENRLEIKHTMNEKWTIFMKYLLESVFKEFSTERKFEISSNTLIVRIKLK